MQKGTYDLGTLLRYYSGRKVWLTAMTWVKAILVIILSSRFSEEIDL